jgi:glycosyltransferase involved in cell wall biosynthesis
MSNIRITIVIPSYNHERFVEDAVRSVLEQTMRDLELIVIDDGSKDDSVALLQRMAADDSRMRVFSQANAGSHATINRGLDMGLGEWLAILNSDDVWEPVRLEAMLAEAERSGADFLFSDSKLIDADGAPVDDPSHWWNFSVSRMRERVRQFGIDDGMLYGNLAVSTSNFLFRRSLVDVVGKFRRYRYNLDWEYVLRCLFTDGVRVHFVDEPLLRYRLHGNNAILSGMPVAAVEAQAITRRLYRHGFHVPDSLSHSHYRHDRLLRRFLSGEARRFKASHDAVTADRDRLADLLRDRQRALEAEREAVVGDVLAIEADRDRLAGLLTQRQLQVELERSATAGRVDTMMRHALAVRAVRDDALRREARMLDEVRGRANTISLWRRLVGCLLPDAWRKRLEPILTGPQTPGVVRRERRNRPVPGSRAITIAAHVHLYYLDLAPELIGDALRIDPLARLVITGPWGEGDLEAFLGEARLRGVDVRVLTVPNRGKDVGGLVAAIRHGLLLDSDLVLKLHSKRSQNPPTYFDAISALFGRRIDNGDQWRRALIDPLAGTSSQVDDVVDAFDSDPTVGMVGAAPFITTAPDANAGLGRATSSRFRVPQGLPFVAGTMFWVRSSLLKPLLDQALTEDDFSLDSREVEGGLEHVMERLLGALVLGAGFDILGVDI